jgi:hypothetical protein
MLGEKKANFNDRKIVKIPTIKIITVIIPLEGLDLLAMVIPSAFKSLYLRICFTMSK